MKIRLALMLCPAFLPTVALAETGGKDSYAAQFIELNDAMKRDGRLQKAMEEGRANKAAFDALKQREAAQQISQQTTATWTGSLPRR